MGYRSDIRIILKKEDFEDLNKQYKEKFDEDNIRYSWFNEFEVCKEYNAKNWNSQKENEEVNLVYFGWDFIKWYTYSEGYEDITFIEEYVRNKGSFARIGEEFDDFEEFGECCGHYASHTFVRKFADEEIGD